MLGMLMWRETEIPHTFTDRQREKVTLPRPDIEEKMYKQAFSPDITMGRRIQRLIYYIERLIISLLDIHQHLFIYRVSNQFLEEGDQLQVNFSHTFVHQF